MDPTKDRTMPSIPLFSPPIDRALDLRQQRVNSPGAEATGALRPSEPVTHTAWPGVVRSGFATRRHGCDRTR